MKTKQAKEELDKSTDEDTLVEPKTRARKKASDVNEEEKSKSSDEPKTSKDLPKKTVVKPKAIVKKRPLGIRKALRSKKVAVKNDKLKNAIKQTVKRGRKPAQRTVPAKSQDKDTVPLILPSEIKKEPVDETSPNSRSSSPKTAGRRNRLSSDMIMMKSVLADPPSSLVLGPRTSPYSMRSERSNSPSLFEGKNLRSGKPRKVKSNLLNEVVLKEQKKRRRLLSDSKPDVSDSNEDCKKLKRGRSCSRDGSEISKCSDITESDISLSDTLNDTDKELNKKLIKPKTDLDLDIENNIQISTIQKVPSLNIDSKLAGTKLETENSMIHEKIKKKQSLKRSTSLDSDNNNSNRIKLDTLNASDIEDKLLMKTEDDTLFEARSSILTSMSKTFNSKEMSKNIRKVRRGRKSATLPRPPPSQPAKNGVSSTVTHELGEEKVETIETLSKEIDDLINNLDQNINKDCEIDNIKSTENTTEIALKTSPRILSTSKPLGDNNIILGPETPIKEKDSMTSVTAESTPSKTDDSENIRLHYEEDSIDQPIESSKVEITYKSVASIDKLMGRLKEFEEFDKRRQRQETKQENKQVMVSNDVVLIPKSGADIKPLKDMQSVKSPERTLEKENVLSCFENNSAISILKRDHVRRSIDIDLPNSVTLIKRNSISSRKESTSSNHSKESDAISIFEKSLGKDVTLTEIKKTAERQAPSSQPDLNQLATLQPTNSSTLAEMGLDSSQISLTPRVINDSKCNSSEIQISKRKSSDPLSRKSSESGSENTEEKMAVIEKIKSPSHVLMFPAISITATPVAVKSPEVQPMETEALAPPLENDNAIPADIPLKSEVPPVESTKTSETMTVEDVKITTTKPEESVPSEPKPETIVTSTQENAEAEVLAQQEAEPPTKNIEALLTTKKVEPTTKKTELTTKKVEPSIKKGEPTTKKAEPTNKKAEPPVKKADPPTKKAEPSSKKVEPPTKKIEPTTKKVEPVTKKGEQATKKTESSIKKAEPLTKKIELTTKKVEPLTKEVETVENVKETEKELVKDTPIEEKEKLETDDIKVKPEIKPEEKAKLVKSKSARNSIENQPGPSSMLHETPESQKRKENVLRTLGLLTHKAANEALKMKLKEKERIYGQSYSGVMSKGKSSKSGDYTGTLKTVIKLNRSAGERDKKKYRSSLKMTFQKSKNRSGKPPSDMGETLNEDDAYYTIERREAAATEGGHRKTHYSNRVNNHADEVPEPEPKETLVIPEKASSFSIHPGRLCMDQCFYCGGKFGLFDTPCHIAQMKSSERQKKVLDNEEKLTIDSCLCDACYRHVDRRANCPSYKKRPPKMVQPVGDSFPTAPGKPPAPSPPAGEDSEEDAGARPAALCHADGCTAVAEHSIKRKWLIKMRASVNKLVRLRSDYPGLHTVPLCASHHARLAPLRRCALCVRAVPRLQHALLLQQDYQELNPILQSAGIPVRFTTRPVLCKLCRYYCSVLLQPGYNDAQAHGYRKKLLQIHKVDIPPELENAPEPESLIEDPTNKQKCKKTRTKSKQRKSSDPDKPSDRESSERTNDSTPEKEKDKETPSDATENKDVEEDIESLISSNKIPVPGAIKHNEQQSDGSEIDPIDIEAQINMSVDKHTELQYLLQKQNNPAQFLQNQPHLTFEKTSKTNKILNAITKPGQQQRIHDKNSKKIQKIGQMIIQSERSKSDDEEKSKEPSMAIFRNLSLNEECTIESIPQKKPADINTLKNKWQQSESFTQVKRNLSELSKKLPGSEKEKKSSDPKYSNPVKRLETNPSISVRELFPGEEEMNLQCNIEFNNVKGVTPEGWEKCNSVIQYDLETRKLWTELQRPYGNQSSFLRHLILLEKYFRSGDLVLSHNATPHAANYSDSVQARLRAYDNVPVEAPRKNESSISLIEFRKKPSLNGKSLLKTNNTEDKEAKKFVAPPPKPKQTKTEKPKSKPLPPELIAINAPNSSRKAMHNVLHNIQQLVKGVSASDPIEVASAPLPPPPSIEPIKEKKEIPKSDTPKKQKPTSKPWRPTLMPITQENLAKIAREPTQVAVDGRKLPSLVQVMSSGKRYHITLQDYNKMCIMRREKLQQIQDGDKTKKTGDETTVVTEIQTSAMLGNGGTVVQNIQNDKESQDKKEMPELSQISSNAATILKNVGLKNITIAPIPPKTATITSQTISSPITMTPSMLVTSTPIKIPQLGPAVSITNETVFTSNLPVMSSNMIMPKIPKSLTVIPQTIMTSLPQTVVVPISSAPTQATSDGPKP